MSWKSPAVLSFLLSVTVVFSPSAVNAQDTRTGTAALRLLLRAHHQAPSAEALSRLVDDPVAALMDVALDEEELMLVRSRAVTLLGSYAEPRVTTFLEGLVVRTTESPLRRAGARSLVRLLGEREPNRVVSVVSRLFESHDPIDREAAVWLLARLDTPAARARLGRQRIIERHRAVVDALRRAADGDIQNRP